MLSKNNPSQLATDDSNPMWKLGTQGYNDSFKGSQ